MIHTTSKKISYHLKRCIFGISLLYLALPAYGGIIVGEISTDTPTRLEVSWKGVVADDGSDTSLTIDGLLNWSISSPVTLAYQGGGDGWLGTITASHTARPHDEKANGELFSAPIKLDQLILTFTTKVKTVRHAPHKNVYVLIYSRDLAGNFAAALTGSHVPEPSTLAFSILGLIGLVSSRFKKQS